MSFRIFTCLVLFLFLFSESEAQTFTTYKEVDGLASDNVNAVSIDSNGDVWFGTQAGISKFDGNTWTTINTTTDPDLVDNSILALLIDGNGNIWAGTDFGVSKFDGSSWTTYTDDDGLADNRIKFIAEGPDGKIWFGNNDGVSSFDGTTWESFTTSNGLPFGGVNHVAFDQNGDVLLGTGLGGLYIYNGTDFSTITEDDQLLSNKIRSSIVDENNNRWIASAEGVSVYSPNNIFLNDHEHFFVLPPPDSLNPIEDIQIDSRGYVWTGVYIDYLVTVGGVAMYDGVRWYNYDETDGLAGPVVRRLAITDEDDVWVTTSTGVTKISDISVGIFTPEVKEDLLGVFPNPASDLLEVSAPTEQIGNSLRIFNALGKLVWEQEMDQQNITVNLSTFQNGFYFISLGDLQAKRIIVNK